MTGKIERLRDVYREWAKGNFHAGPELWDRRVMFVMNPPLPEAGSYVGADEIRAYMVGFLDPWERVAIEPLEFTEAGDTVIVPVRQHGRGKGSGVPVEMRYTQLWTFGGDRLIRLENFADHAEALEAARAPNIQPRRG